MSGAALVFGNRTFGYSIYGDSHFGKKDANLPVIVEGGGRKATGQKCFCGKCSHGRCFD